AAADFIGQFGVGFYSCFKVADRVTVITRRDDDTVGTRWESHGVADYTIDDVADCQRGTAVTLELKPKDAEIGIEDYTERVVLERVVRRYTDFISYPIVYVGPDSVVDSSGQRTERADARIILNSQRPIWTRPEQEVTAQEYTEFYHHITNDWTEPLLRMSLKAEGRWEYSSLLFVPAQAPSDLFYHDARFGLQLYSNRILLVDECSDLIPRYLRFVKGVVDAADVPLNVSRQALQHPEHLVRIRRWLTRRVLDTIATLKSKDALKFSTLWQQFGRVLKEGIAEDHENRDRLLSFSMFRSSMSDEPTTLGAYVSRMKSEQLHIYYLTGQTRQVIEASPHKEQCRKLGYEVLYLDEPVDELVVQAVPHYNSHALKSVATFR
ncbi:MAG: molecular chaperone HtpG, partial [Vicinamibacterales bacterium]